MNQITLRTETGNALPTHTIVNSNALNSTTPDPARIKEKTLSEFGNKCLSAVKSTNASCIKSVITLPETGFIRLPAVLSLIPVSKSTWWNGIRSGRYPKPTKKFGPRISAWDVRDIRALIESVA